MKKAVLSSVLMALCILAIAQAPESFSYQVIVRDGSNNPIQNQSVSFRMSILKGSISGSSQYSELHSGTTTGLGLVTLAIGNGTDKIGDISTIDWGADTYYLKVEIDKTGGSTYVEMGTTQLLSVPYAMYSKKAGAVTETDPIFSVSPANGIIGTDITNWNTAYGWGNHSLIGYVPGTRILTVNGTALDLSDNRSWSVGTVTSVGLTLPSIFSVSGSPVTTSGTLDASFVSQTNNKVFASPNGSTGVPTFRTLASSDIPLLDWSKITSGKPTTLSGYGITDGVNTAGNQTITGNKTFTGTTTVQTPVNATDATTKAYVDGLKSLLFVTADPSKLLAAGVSIADLLNAGVSVADLLADGVNVVDLLNAGASVAELLAAGVSVATLLAAGVSVADLLNAGASVADLLAAGVSVADLLAAGASVADLLAAGASVADLLAAGASVADLVTAGASVADLLSAGVSIADLFNAGVGVGALEQNGVTSQQLIEAGLIGTVLDIDGNTYKWVKIGTQVWMAENLKTINYKNGTAIEYPGTDNTAWANNTTGAYAWYNNNEATYKPTYGALYNWFSVNTGNLCPSNWHIPNDADWTILIDYLGGVNVAGGKLKEVGTTHWKSPNPGATNETGFTALPGGYRLPGGLFFDIRNYGYYWSATEATSISAFFRQSIADFSNINRGSTNKEYGMLVRCIKD